MDIENALTISASGLRAQGTRIRVIAENLANAESTAQTPGGEPYRRKTITFKQELDRATGADLVKVNKIQTDGSDYELKYDPAHPAANAQGYVLMPNVKPLIEMTDMREAQRSYEANATAIETSKNMLIRTLGILTPGG